MYLIFKILFKKLNPLIKFNGFFFDIFFVKNFYTLLGNNTYYIYIFVFVNSS